MGLEVIFISNRFSIERDKYQWLLHEIYQGKDKDGNPKDQVRTTYHSKFNHIATAILDRSAGDCTSVEELKTLFNNAVIELTTYLEEETDESK